MLQETVIMCQCELNLRNSPLQIRCLLDITKKERIIDHGWWAGLGCSARPTVPDKNASVSKRSEGGRKQSNSSNVLTNIVVEKIINGNPVEEDRPESRV